MTLEPLRGITAVGALRMLQESARIEARRRKVRLFAFFLAGCLIGALPMLLWLAFR